jgi:hypothetical protein
MSTHAQSVIHDFERAVSINPQYEAKVRRYIEAAKGILARGEQNS